MRNYFLFNGKDSRDYGVYISGQGAFNAPSREYETIDIPGRNGSLLGVEKRLGNVTLRYPAFIYASFKENAAALRSMLLAQIGYQRLEDSYNPDEFRLAYYAGDMEIDATQKNDAGEMEIEFFCKPQRFLKIGEEIQTFTESGTITNPTLFDAQPRIRVYGNGEMYVGSYRITIAETSEEYIDIDCEIMDCFTGTINQNANVTIQANSFPVLKAGDNGITFGSGITQVEILPRWWRV